MTLPSTRKEPGVYHDYVFLKKRGQLEALIQRVMLVAEKSAEGTAPVGVPVQVFGIDHGDTFFGPGSPLALMVRAAFAVLDYRDSIPQIWATPVAAPQGATAAAAETTLTVTGTAQTTGVVRVAISDVTLRVSVVTGATATDIAAAIAAAVNARDAELPCNATATAVHVTTPAVCAGENGNAIRYAVDASELAGVAVAVAQSKAGAGIVALAPVLDNLSQDYQGWAFANHTADDVSAVTAHLALGWAVDGGANCGWGFIGTTASLGTAQALAAEANKIQTVVVACTDSPSTPGQIAAAVATLAFSAEAPNANFDDAELPIAAPPEASEYQSGPEMESLLEGGVTPLARSRTNPDRARLVKLQTTRVLDADGNADDSQTDIVVGKVAAYLAEQKQLRVRRMFPNATLTEDNVDGILDAVLSVHHQAHKAGYIEQPDTAAITANIDPSAPGRLVVKAAHSPVLPLHQLYLIHESQI